MTAAVAFIAMNVASGVMQYRQSQAQAASLRFQGQMAGLQAQERSLSYRREEMNAQKQANDVMDRLARANSAVIARSAAMNINPLSGSPLDLQAYNNKRAGSEWEIAQSNKELAALGGKNALLAGEMQKSEYNRAADTTEEAGMWKMLMSFGNAAYGYSQLGSAPVTPNSMYSVDRVNSFDDGSMMMRFR